MEGRPGGRASVSSEMRCRGATAMLDIEHRNTTQLKTLHALLELGSRQLQTSRIAPLASDFCLHLLRLGCTIVAAAVPSSLGPQGTRSSVHVRFEPEDCGTARAGNRDLDDRTSRTCPLCVLVRAAAPARQRTSARRFCVDRIAGTGAVFRTARTAPEGTCRGSEYSCNGDRARCVEHVPVEP
ncbi:hypothetical protein BD310DRAFT_925863, partial [Dichomitus squalens]